MRAYTERYFRTMISLVCGLSLVSGVALGAVWTNGPTGQPEASPTATASTYTVPTGSPSPTLPAREDSPGWDCRVQGNHVCGFDGELWLNVSHLPASLYARCLLGLGATGLSPEMASIDTAEICKPLYVNG